MTSLEKTYRQLRSAGLVHCAEAFSVDYLSKNKNWFSYQRCTGRDFSVDAAVQCLRTIRTQQLKPQLSEAQQRVLTKAAQFLLAHLNTKHCVADVC
jgi:hypothetical protein